MKRLRRPKPSWRTALPLAALVLIAGMARAEDAPVVEEILEILRSRGQIDEQQYHELRERARTEAESRGRASDRDFRVYWKDGLRMETGDGDFELRIGGRAQLDAAVIAPSQAVEDLFGDGDPQTGVRFRRARIYLRGVLYRDFDFKFQYDFEGGEVGFKDVYVGASHVPILQRIQIGHFKEPFSLEQLTSSNDIVFMERSLMSPFEEGRNVGIAAFLHTADKRLTLAAGGFREVDRFGDGFGANSDYDLTARVTFLPWFSEEEGELLHLGLSYQHRFRHGSEDRFRQRPEASLGRRLVDTGAFQTNDADLLNPELALVAGPFAFQAEYAQSFFDTPDGGDPRFFGWYAQASYFLTGEHLPYKAKAGKFERLHPRRDFGWRPGSGWGAWQVGARLSQLNLASGGIDGGRLTDLTLGLNWYLNPNMRVMLNYVYGDRSPIGSENVWQTRFQIAF